MISQVLSESGKEKKTEDKEENKLISADSPESLGLQPQKVSEENNVTAPEPREEISTIESAQL